MFGMTATLVQSPNVPLWTSNATMAYILMGLQVFKQGTYWLDGIEDWVVINCIGDRP